MNVIKILRSPTAGNRPTTALAGEPYVNFPDKQFGVVDASDTPLDLIAVRFFSATATYVVGDHVVEAGGLYACSTAVTTPGAFDPADWTGVGIAPDLSGYLQLAGGTMTGALLLAADPAVAAEAANKAYVDALRTDVQTGAAAQALLYLPLTAGAAKALTGALHGTGAVFSAEVDIATAPSLATSATNKLYVDTADTVLQDQIDLLLSNLLFVGSIAVQTDVGDYSPESGITDGPLPAAAPANRNMYVIVTDGGVAATTGNIPADTYNPADWLVSDGVAWTRLSIGLGTAAAVIAPNVALQPPVNAWADVQVAVQGLFDTKLDQNSTIDGGTF